MSVKLTESSKEEYVEKGRLSRPEAVKKLDDIFGNLVKIYI